MTKTQVFLIEAGFNPNNLGFKYIPVAAEIIRKNPAAEKQITTTLYPMIAKKFGSTASRVERAIRQSIERACSAMTPDVAQYVEEKWQAGGFSNLMFSFEGKPKNKDFISYLVLLFPEEEGLEICP